MTGIRTSRLRIALLTFLMLGCGEAKEDIAVRDALAPLIHRNRVLTDEYVRWIDREEAGAVTWGQSHEALEKFMASKDTLVSLTRAIVPTEKYDCIIKLVSRSIEADKAAIASRLNNSRQNFRVKTQLSVADDHLAEARSSYYGSDVYLRAARRAMSEAQEAQAQAKSFMEAENREALLAQMVADTLAATVLHFRLLPSADRQRYPIITDSGPDSLLQHTQNGPPAACMR